MSNEGDAIKIRPVPTFEVYDVWVEPDEPTISASKVKSIYWYQELETSRPTMYGTFLTEAEALDMCKGYHAYGRVSGIGGLL